MFQRSAFLVMTDDRGSATALGAALRARLSAGGTSVPVLTPPMSASALADPAAQSWLRSWWDEQQTGVPLSATVVVALGGDPRQDSRAARVGSFGATTEDFLVDGVGELADTVAGYALTASVRGASADSADPDSDADSRSDSRPDDAESAEKPGRRIGFVPAAVVTGALVAGGWMLTAALHPGSAEAQTVHHTTHDSSPQTDSGRSGGTAVPGHTTGFAYHSTNTSAHPTHTTASRGAVRTMLNLVPPHRTAQSRARSHANQPQRSFPWSHALQNELHGRAKVPAGGTAVPAEHPDTPTPTYGTRPVLDIPAPDATPRADVPAQHGGPMQPAATPAGDAPTRHADPRTAALDAQLSKVAHHGHPDTTATPGDQPDPATAQPTTIMVPLAPTTSSDGKSSDTAIPEGAHGASPDLPAPGTSAPDGGMRFLPASATSNDQPTAPSAYAQDGFAPVTDPSTTPSGAGILGPDSGGQDSPVLSTLPLNTSGAIPADDTAVPAGSHQAGHQPADTAPDSPTGFATASPDLGSTLAGGTTDASTPFHVLPATALNGPSDAASPSVTPAAFTTPLTSTNQDQPNTLTSTVPQPQSDGGSIGNGSCGLSDPAACVAPNPGSGASSQDPGGAPPSGADYVNNLIPQGVKDTASSVSDALNTSIDPADHVDPGQAWGYSIGGYLGGEGTGDEGVGGKLQVWRGVDADGRSATFIGTSTGVDKAGFVSDVTYGVAPTPGTTLNGAINAKIEGLGISAGGSLSDPNNAGQWKDGVDGQAKYGGYGIKDSASPNGPDKDSGVFSTRKPSFSTTFPYVSGSEGGVMEIPDDNPLDIKGAPFALPTPVTTDDGTTIVPDSMGTSFGPDGQSTVPGANADLGAVADAVNPVVTTDDGTTIVPDSMGTSFGPGDQNTVPFNGNSASPDSNANVDPMTDVGNAYSNFANDAGNVYNGAVNGIQGAANDAGNAYNNFANDAENVYNGAVNGIQGAASDAGNAYNNFANDFGFGFGFGGNDSTDPGTISGQVNPASSTIPAGPDGALTGTDSTTTQSLLSPDSSNSSDSLSSPSTPNTTPSTIPAGPGGALTGTNSTTTQNLLSPDTSNSSDSLSNPSTPNTTPSTIPAGPGGALTGTDSTTAQSLLSPDSSTSTSTPGPTDIGSGASQIDTSGGIGGDAGTGAAGAADAGAVAGAAAGGDIGASMGSDAGAAAGGDMGASMGGDVGGDVGGAAGAADAGAAAGAAAGGDIGASMGSDAGAAAGGDMGASTGGDAGGDAGAAGA